MQDATKVKTWRAEMDQRVAKACEELDAVIFSGESFDNPKVTIDSLKWYLNRWDGSYNRFKKMIDMLENGGL